MSKTEADSLVNERSNAGADKSHDNKPSSYDVSSAVTHASSASEVIVSQPQPQTVSRIECAMNQILFFIDFFLLIDYIFAMITMLGFYHT